VGVPVSARARVIPVRGIATAKAAAREIAEKAVARAVLEKAAEGLPTSREAVCERLSRRPTASAGTGMPTSMSRFTSSVLST